MSSSTPPYDFGPEREPTAIYPVRVKEVRDHAQTTVHRMIHVPELHPIKMVPSTFPYGHTSETQGPPMWAKFPEDYTGPCGLDTTDDLTSSLEFSRSMKKSPPHFPPYMALPKEKGALMFPALTKEDMERYNRATERLDREGKLKKRDGLVDRVFPGIAKEDVEHHVQAEKHREREEELRKREEGCDKREIEIEEREA
ncbi:MAG: hypothetical protein Q9210_004521 [Variospora velana]